MSASGKEAQSSIKTLSTHEVSEQYLSKDTVVVDVRSPDAYNGWKENGEKRGGHIPGAKNLPAKWADYIDWFDIVEAKEISSDKNLIVYGASAEEAELVAKRLQRVGYEKAVVYPGFVEEWTADNNLPLEELPRHQHLVPAWWVKKHFHDQAGNGAEKKMVVTHVHYRNPDDYDEGHIPGAIPLNTNWLESTETWNRRSPEELKDVLEKMGIDQDTTVVVYGRFSSPDPNDPYPGSSAGQLGAFRCAFILLYAGVKDVRILNGGIQAWEDAGYELSREKVEPTPVTDFGASIPGRPELAVDLPEAKEILASDKQNLVSVRSWPEFIGEVSGYNYIEKKGRIPGAVFADCGSDAYHMENYRNLDHTLRDFNEVADIWKNLGITSDKKNAFYCGTGWRGSEAFFNAWLMGWHNVAVFDGGWFEWSNNNEPYETGIPSNYQTSSPE